MHSHLLVQRGMVPFANTTHRADKGDLAQVCRARRSLLPVARGQDFIVNLASVVDPQLLQNFRLTLLYRMSFG